MGPVRSRLLPPALGLLVLAGATGCDSCSKEAAQPPRNTNPEAAPVNVSPVPTASVAAMVNPDRLPAYTGATGSVEGVVTVKGQPPPDTPADFHKCPDAAETWGKAFRVGAEGALADAVVAVTGYEGFYVPETAEQKTIEIRGCAFAQRTLTVTFGQRIEVKNDSDQLWTPVLEPGLANVLRMAPPHGDPVRIYPKRPGHYLLSDRDRRYAVVDVYVFLHPLHTTTNLEGKYRIDGIPVGKMKLNARHPRFEAETSTEIDVKPGVIKTYDLVLENESAVPKTYDAGAGYPGLR